MVKCLQTKLGYSFTVKMEWGPDLFIIFLMAEMWVQGYLQSLCTYMVLDIVGQFSIYSFF